MFLVIGGVKTKIDSGYNYIIRSNELRICFPGFVSLRSDREYQALYR